MYIGGAPFRSFDTATYTSPRAVRISSAVAADPDAMRHLVAEVRAIYGGKLVYAANWDEIDRVRFWDALDYVGVQLYAPLARRADESDEAMKAFGVWVEKSMYGRKYFGIQRSTFVIDAKGQLVQEWRGVKVPGHAAEVLAFVQSLG